MPRDFIPSQPYRMRKSTTRGRLEHAGVAALTINMLHTFKKQVSYTGLLARKEFVLTFEGPQKQLRKTVREDSAEQGNLEICPVCGGSGSGQWICCKQDSDVSTASVNLATHF